jgi:hypothetical protein
MRESQEFFLRHNTVDQAERQRLVGCNGATEEKKFHGPLVTEEPREDQGTRSFGTDCEIEKWAFENARRVPPTPDHSARAL